MSSNAPISSPGGAINLPTPLSPTPALKLPLSPGGRRYGRLYDRNDSRDCTLSTAPVFRTVKIPPTIDTRALLGPMKDQGQEGSCTGHAYSSLAEYQFRKFVKLSPVLSPQFLYAQELIAEGSFPQDNGAMPRTGCQILSKFGCCEETSFPYVAGQLFAPTPAQVSNASRFKVNAYHRIGNVADALSCLASGYTFTIGFAVYDSFESEAVATSGIMPVPNVDAEMLLGGHEVHCVGYDISTTPMIRPAAMKEKAVLVQNSWGMGWGILGFFWMPLSVLGNYDLVSDMWMAHLGHPW